MSLNREQALFMQHVAELINKAQDFGLAVTGGELFRTPEQQQIYLRDGRSKTLNSRHLKRLAIDLNFFRRGADDSLHAIYDVSEVRSLGAFWESLDPVNRWGGNWKNFKDLPHFERCESGTSPAPATVTAAPPASKRGAKLLAGSVGAGGQNQHDDVESIQRLLNLNKDRYSRAAPLKPDGIFGTKTAAAIQKFQTEVLSAPEPSGLIKPGDACLLNLCTVLPADVDLAVLALAFLRAAEDELALLGPELLQTMTRYAIDTPFRRIHFLAQVGHESGEFRFRTELASGKAYEGRADLGNTQQGDGPRFKGRGLIQLTGRSNYTDYAAANSFNVDVLNTPDKVSSDDRLCADVAGWFWKRKELNLLADRDDLEGITRHINGGLNGLADRRRLYERLKTLAFA
jgi:predicted chitinase